MADIIVVTFDHGDYTFGGISQKLLHLAHDISVIIVDQLTKSRNLISGTIFMGNSTRFCTIH